MARDIRYYNIGVKNEGDWIRVGDKSYPVPAVGDYVDIPLMYEPIMRRRYPGFSRNPNAANKVRRERALENPTLLSDAQLQAELERLQAEAANRLAAKFNNDGEGKPVVAETKQLVQIEPSFLPILTKPLEEYTVLELKEFADQTGVLYTNTVKKQDLIQSMIAAGFPSGNPDEEDVE